MKAGATTIEGDINGGEHLAAPHLEVAPSEPQSDGKHGISNDSPNRATGESLRWRAIMAAIVGSITVQFAVVPQPCASPSVQDAHDAGASVQPAMTW
ncbi:MAG: hypothetical protein IT427_14165 [Pirellulales bacterium]|nr:hypothetical protein [Pirellulales bacterium]